MVSSLSKLKGLIRTQAVQKNSGGKLNLAEKKLRDFKVLRLKERLYRMIQVI